MEAMNRDDKMNIPDKENNAAAESEYDRPDMKHTPGNRQENELRSLQERLEQYKRDPAGTPWESAFEKLLHSTPVPGEDIC
jgi:hypothetical protein